MIFTAKYGVYSCGYKLNSKKITVVEMLLAPFLVNIENLIY